MRLHRLEIEAFGPFGGHETVDFDALSDSGLFLLSGPTGAGKTSVLDAVCFALFGEVPGARGDAARLASDHRSPEATPRVTLEATVGGRRIRVVRVPKHLRPAKKGGGAPVDDGGSAVLALADPDAEDGWRAVAAKIPEVRRELDPLLGMTAEQFLQVVMLPQGAFATFLRADAKARREVLERLFDAGRFSKIELWLQDRAREARQTVEQQQIAADNALAEAGGAWIAGSPPPVLRDGSTVDDVDAWLAAERHRLEAARAAAAITRDAAQQALAAIDRERDDARALADRQRQRLEAEARLRTLDEQAAEHAERVAQLEAHRRAAPLAGYLSSARQTRSRAAECARTLAKAHGWITQLEDERLRVDDPTTWSAGAQDRTASVAALTELVVQEQGLPGRRQELQRLNGAVDAASERAAAVQSRIDQQDAAEAALEQRRVAADAAGADVARLREQLRTAQERAHAGGERDRLATHEAQAAEAAHSATDRHQAAVDAAQGVRQARLDGYAAELAQGLREEAPCPVCGSVHHPAPATPGAGHVTADQERAALDAATAAQHVREAAAQQANDLRSALAAAARVAGDAPTADLNASAEDLTRQLQHAESAAADGERAALARQELALRRTDDQRARDEARESATQLAAQADLLRAEIERLHERILAERGDYATVEARVTALKDQARHLERAINVHTDDVNARKALEDAERALTAVMAEHGVDDADAAISAILTPKDADALAASVRHVDETRAAVRSVLDRPEIAATPLDPPVDLDAVEQRRRQASAEDEASASTAASCARCAEAEASRRDALRTRLDALAPLREAADRAHALAELARGGSGNQRRIQLSSWVLAARLEQVAAAATVHLLEMSSGRYRLVLHEEAASGRGKGNAGLGLRVLDGWTGEQRDTTTLSGGESFFASLSLALGLAETVTAEAGGIDLGTLFIDEGFGSLDEQTLEDVLEQLDKLRDGGRAVGIVSHVPELKQRIPVQLTVEKARDGSRLRQTVGVAG